MVSPPALAQGGRQDVAGVEPDPLLRHPLGAGGREDCSDHSVGVDPEQQTRSPPLAGGERGFRGSGLVLTCLGLVLTLDPVGPNDARAPGPATGCLASRFSSLEYQVYLPEVRSPPLPQKGRACDVREGGTIPV